jgi:hypothetical protein
MNRERIRLIRATGTQGARDRRRDPAAHRARRHHLHQHQDGEHQRDARERVRAEHADEIGLDEPDRSLHEHDEHIGRCQPEQRRGNRAFQQKARSRVHASDVRTSRS